MLFIAKRKRTSMVSIFKIPEMGKLLSVYRQTRYAGEIENGFCEDSWWQPTGKWSAWSSHLSWSLHLWWILPVTCILL